MKRRRVHTPVLAPVSENQTDDTTVASNATHALTEEALVEKAKDDLEKWQLQKKLKEVTDEKEALQKAYDDLRSRTSYKADVMMHDDKKVKYYTGLPSFSMLKAIYDYVSTNLSTCMKGAKLDVFEQLMLVLMKLRVNLRDQDLAYRFGISQSTVSRYFSKVMELLYARLSCLVCWPERG